MRIIQVTYTLRMPLGGSYSVIGINKEGKRCVGLSPVVPLDAAPTTLQAIIKEMVTTEAHVTLKEAVWPTPF